MKQSRLMSLVEAVANVAVGYGVAVTTQLLVFPWFGLPARVSDALAIGAIFTGLCGAPHKMVYAERMIMWSLRRRGLAPQGFRPEFTPHNFGRCRFRRAWRSACPAR